MNKFKEEIKEEPVIKEKSKNKIGQSVLSFISGSFLTKEETLKLMPFVFFMSAMAIIYIANGYYAEQKIRELNTLTNELKELKSEYIISKSDLMFISKQSEVAKASMSLEIKESVIPPKKILVESEEITNNNNE